MIDFIIDSHCHLDLIEDKGIFLAEILQNCDSNNVKILQTICTKISDLDRLLNFCKQDPRIYCSIGVHPCNVANHPLFVINDIISLCSQNKKIIGIGETGLDYYHNLDSIALQKKFFEDHISVSRETNLPVIIHSRNADSDMIEILNREKKHKDFPALLHCFSSTRELALKAIDLNILISVSGIITFKNAHELQGIIKDVPLEYLLIETDSPYLAPSPFRGKINQPSNVFYVAKAIAEIKSIKIEKVIEITTNNFLKIFSRVEY